MLIKAMVKKNGLESIVDQHLTARFEQIKNKIAYVYSRH